MIFDSSNGIDLKREGAYVGLTGLNSTILLPLLLSLMQQRFYPKVKNAFKKEYDYIIVGGGTAGSSVAGRLSEESGVDVLLLEDGDVPPILSEFPILAYTMWNSDIDYSYKTVPQKNLGYAFPENKQYFRAGKVLGGTTAINGLLYVRGNRHNYDEWEELGADGWNYQQILPYFIKSENNSNDTYVASGYHGKGGPLSISDQLYNKVLRDAVVEAVSDLGYEIGDSNGRVQTGFYPVQAAIRKSQRCSAAKAFLVPAENRKNLDIVTKAHVNKIVIEGQPLRAVGVQFDHGGVSHVVRARREVILSAGVINSPKLLMLSGIGPEHDLKEHGIKVLKDLPVGKNFVDQPMIMTDFLMNPSMPPLLSKIGNIFNLLQYIINRSGPLSSNFVVTLLGFLKTSEAHPNVDFPDIEMYFVESDISGYKNQIGIKNDIYDAYFKRYEMKPLMQCLVHLVQPKSRGTVTLKTNDPYDDPLIDPNYLADPRDLEDLVKGMKLCRKIVQSDPVQRDVGARPLDGNFPGCEKFIRDEEDYLKCYIRHMSSPSWHGCCTARMGDPNDPAAVLDPELKVKGVQGLRVVDASVMPKITSGNIMAPVYMIAEKAADMIKADFIKDLFKKSNSKE